MKISNSAGDAFVLALSSFIGSAVFFISPAAAELVLISPQFEAPLSAAAKLEPARDKLRQGHVAECREIVARVVAEEKDLPHADVLVALWLNEAGQFVACHQLLELLSKSEPGRMDLHYACAELSRKQGRNYDAWTHLAAAEAAKPPATWSPEFAAEFASSILLSKAIVAEAREDWTTAGKLYRRLQDAAVSGPPIEMGLGRSAFQEGNVDAAEVHFRQAAKLAPETVIPEIMMAALFANEKKSQQADEWFQRGEKENQKHADRIRLDHAMWLLREQRGPEALRLALAGKSDNPLADEYRIVRSLAYYMLEKYDESASEIAPLAQNSPNNTRVTNQLALALVESDREHERGRALKLAQTNVAALPDSPDLLSALAWIQFRMNDLAAAQQTTDTVLRRGGQLSRDSAYFLAQILRKLDRTQEAETLLELTRNTSGDFLNARRLSRSEPAEKK